MPLLVNSAKAAPEAVATPLENGVLELVPRGCGLQQPKLIKTIPSFNIKSSFIAFASPDSTYAVHKRLLDDAKKEIRIGIYDLTAVYMKELLLNAMQRKVKVTLMLDIDSKDEQAIFDDLAKFGANAVEAPSCASKIKAARFFSSCHEKFIIIDGTWCIVQSGNYSNNSIPLNEKDGGDPKKFVKGNRDMGVAIRSAALSSFFTKVLKSDIKLELDAEGVESLTGERAALPDLIEAVPKKIPIKLFPSKTFNPTRAIKVTPVLTPDNYMTMIPAFLESARKSILIENQYIRSSQSEIAKLLAAIKKAKTKNPKLDVRIILGKLFSQKDVPKEEANIANIKATFGLTLSKNIRYIDTTRFVHCHNKLIIVDGQSVLVSSQNWSNSAVSANREAGVIMEYPDIAKYYAQIFESDWSTALKTIPQPGMGKVAPEAVGKGNFVRVVAADYQEV